MASDAHLRELALRAANATEGIPDVIRGHLAAAVFNSMLSDGTAARTVKPSQGSAETRTLGEMVATIGHRSHAELLLAFAVHSLRTGSADSMTADELTGAYKSVRLSRPQNLSDSIAKAMRRGWLVSGEDRAGKKTWRPTQRGLEEFSKWA